MSKLPPGYKPKTHRVIVDPEKVRPLAERLWNNEQIAGYLNVSRHTLEWQLAEELDAWRECGKAKLLDIAWSRVLKNHLSDRVLIEMLRRYVFKTHLDKFRVELEAGVINPTDKTKDLFKEIKEVVDTRSEWESYQEPLPQLESQSLDSQSAMEPLEEPLQDSTKTLNNTEEPSSISKTTT